MGYWEYVYISGQWFWQHWSVTLLLSIFEGGLFLWFIDSLPHRREEFAFQWGGRTLFLALCTVIQLQHMQVVYHCIAFLLLWTGYLLLFRAARLSQALFYSGIFCLTTELIKLLLKDGVVAGLIAYVLPDLQGGVLNGIILILYLYSLGKLIYLLRDRLLSDPAVGRDFAPAQTLGLLLPLILHLFVRNLQFYYMGEDDYLWLQLQLIQIANACCALIIVLTTELALSAARERNEHLTREMLLREQQQQYLLRKESIDAVNRKYHDLKHYLAGFEALAATGSTDSTQVQSYVKAIGDELRPYEQFLDTGNEVLDILLPERIRACQEKEIRLVPLIDGRKLDFIAVPDLCAIFGNAMDNAMEATEKLEPAKREIHVRIGVTDGFAMLCFRNRFDGHLKKQGDRLLSRKTNAAEHGYGLDNIRRIAEQYGGTAAYEIEGEEFSLNVLLPLPKADV